MKSLREKFEDDYTAVSVPAENRMGYKIKYVYDAPWYIWNLPEHELKRKKWLLTGVSVGSLILFILTGMQSSILNSYVFVEIPGIFALSFHVLELFSMFQFLAAGYRTTRMTYNSVNRILSWVPMVRGGCLITAAAAGIYYLLSAGGDMIAGPVIAGYLVCAFMALYVFGDYRRLSLRTEKNEMIRRYEYQ